MAKVNNSVYVSDQGSGRIVKVKLNYSILWSSDRERKKHQGSTRQKESTNDAIERADGGEAMRSPPGEEVCHGHRDLLARHRRSASQRSWHDRESSLVSVTPAVASFQRFPPCSHFRGNKTDKCTNTQENTALPAFSG